MTTVGWYVHHHGNGHRTRFLAVRPHLDADVVAFSSLPAPEPLPERTTWVVLPRDDDGEIAGDVTAGGMLHWVPVGHRGHRARLAAIARAADEQDLAALVVDVSVEVALFARLLGVPVVLFGQPGERVDPPHRIAQRIAARVVVPWAAGAIPLAGFDADDPRLRFVGAISRFDGRPRAGAPERGTVVVLGGPPVQGEAPGWRIESPPWVADPWPLLTGADVVVTPAGQNAIADLAAAGARAVVVPEDRPFGEQAATGAALAAHGLAVVTRRVDADALERARRLQPEWALWRVEGSAARAAAAIAEVLA